MPTVPEKITALFEELDGKEPIEFPKLYRELRASSKKGVYVILSPGDKVLHVGNTPRAKHGIHQRLRDHLRGRSSFATHYLKGEGNKLRNRYKFKYIKVRGAKQRAYLQAYAIGVLCPEHIGGG